MNHFLRQQFPIFLLFVLQNTAFSQVISIQTARQLGAGATVTVRGIVTNGAEFGKIRYIQDGTAGVGCFPGTGSQPNFETMVKLGDSIEVTGPLVNYSNLLEMSPITSWSVISSNNPSPQPKKISFQELDEPLEGQLVQVDCANFAAAGSTFSAQGQYQIVNPFGEIGEVYLRSSSPILNSPIPTGSTKITGVLSHFQADYQILPRSTADFEATSCFFISKPKLVSFSKNNLLISWTTNLNGSTRLLFGTSPALGAEKTDALQTATDHLIDLQNLMPGTIYWVKAISQNGSATVESEVVPFATESESSGKLKVFFTESVDATVGGGQYFPDGDSPNEALQEILNRIDSAKLTIDAAIYNNDQAEIINHLIAAYNKGVRIRYVADGETANTALQPPPPFPVIFDKGQNLMHNKFLSIDAESVNDSWVMSGSMNWTVGSIFSDYNNVVWLQDQSLARTYRVEFEEMWGSNGPQPNESASLWGASKHDNTPHFFRIGGRNVESYFSPSDGVTKKIAAEIHKADYQLAFALLAFTMDELGDSIVARYQNNGVNCRGVIDDYNGVGTELTKFQAVGMPVKGDDKPAVIHHKYCTFDWSHADSDPTVVTGSHNWSLTAETGNDENTLVIHDQKTAILYAMEFQKRFDEIIVSSHEPQLKKSDWTIYPNPASAFFLIENHSDEPLSARLEVFDSASKLLTTSFFSGKTARFSTENLPDGFYFLKITTANGVTTFPLQTVRR